MDDDGVRLTGYDLFVRIAKSLALKLPHAKDRVMAAKWIRKIDNLMDLDFPQKTKYLKLINISMQSRVLVGPFTYPPPKDDFDIQELYNLKPIDIKDMVVDKKKINLYKTTPYYAEISNDLKEYVVVQEIPDFGTHFYYACSVEPITSWRHHNFSIVPKGALESSITVPPNPSISASKEEFVKNYNAYVAKFNNKGKDCPKIVEDDCEPEEEKPKCNVPKRHHRKSRKSKTEC